MKEKINIAELLKNCLEGTELYSPIFGNVYLCRVRPSLAVIVRVSDRQEEFLYDGRFGINGECMLFPSKENRDWSTFQRPFTDGDVVAATITSGIWMGIFKQYNGIYFESYCSLSTAGEFYSKGFKTHQPTGLRFATEEEKQKLFAAIKENGYKWNPETKTLEKLVEPKFKVGDRIKEKKAYISGIITDISDGTYRVEYKSGGVTFANIAFQDNWELVPSKFDFATLKPFESRVLVRDYDSHIWKPAIWGLKTDVVDYPYIVVGGIPYCQCIPYEGNEHLLDTTTDCDEYYKTWK